MARGKGYRHSWERNTVSYPRVNQRPIQLKQVATGSPGAPFLAPVPVFRFFCDRQFHALSKAPRPSIGEIDDRCGCAPRLGSVASPWSRRKRGPILGLRLPAMGRDANPAELRFAGCTDQQSVDAELELTVLP